MYREKRIMSRPSKEREIDRRNLKEDKSGGVPLTGSSGDPGTQSIVGRARARTGGI
jgi:hypothetical protein